MVQISTRKRPPSTVSDKSHTRKHEILMAASRVFRRKGLHASGMRDIAAEMGMHVSNLYYYFENKQALLAFCQEETLDRLLQLAREARRLDRRADGKLHWLIRGHVRTLNAEIPASLSHLEVEALGPEKRRLVSRRRRRYERTYRSLVKRGIDEGVFRATDPKVAVLAILGAVNWTVKWFREPGSSSLEEIGSEFADLMVRGLLAPGVEARFEGSEV